MSQMSGKGEADGLACGAVRPLLELRARGGLDDGREGLVRDHLAACAGCREAAAEIDPASLFLVLRDEPLPADLWNGFNERLRARLERPARFWPGLLRHGRLAYLLAPLATLLVIGATFFVMRPVRQDRLAARGEPAPSSTAPVMEEIGSPGARVYRFTVGATGEETPIYLVVDESIDI
jgi:hypothetical protein